MTLAPPGSTSTCPTVATAPVDRERGVADRAGSRVGGRDERVVAARHRRRPGVPRAPLEDELAARVADDPGHDAERRVPLGQHRALLDVELEERCGSGPPRATSARLPMHPTSSPRNTTTEPAPTRSTASIAATTPSAPSKRPPCGTVSRCDPTQTSLRLTRRRARRGCRGGRPRPRARPPRATPRRAGAPRPRPAIGAAGSRPARRRSRRARSRRSRIRTRGV